MPCDHIKRIVGVRDERLGGVSGWEAINFLGVFLVRRGLMGGWFLGGYKSAVALGRQVVLIASDQNTFEEVVELNACQLLVTLNATQQLSAW